MPAMFPLRKKAQPLGAAANTPQIMGGNRGPCRCALSQASASNSADKGMHELVSAR